MMHYISSGTISRYLPSSKCVIKSMKSRKKKTDYHSLHHVLRLKKKKVLIQVAFKLNRIFYFFFFFYICMQFLQVILKYSVVYFFLSCCVCVCMYVYDEVIYDSNCPVCLSTILSIWKLVMKLNCSSVQWSSK